MNLYLILLIFSFTIILILIYIALKQKNIIEIVKLDNEALRVNVKDLENENNKCKLDYAVLHSHYISDNKAAKEKLEILQNVKDELYDEFKILAGQIFEDKTKKFDYAHKEQFEMLLKPFREQITNFSNQSKEQFNYESKERHLLKNELLRLEEMNSRLSQEALNLTNALKGDNKAQGNWGEVVLERILEESGLRAGIEYETQATYKSIDDKIYRPDVVIHMPQARDIVIDSKVSLVAYERFVNEKEPKAKELALKEHLKSIQEHIKGLSSKEYEKLQNINSLDYVLLFMPIEGAFLLALEFDGEFFKQAFESNILVVSPSTLLVTLRTIEHVWRIQRQQDNAKRIAQEAEAMYDKLVLFVDEMHKVGGHLQKAQDSYDASLNRLKTGKGNVIKRAQNIVELGLRPKKKLNISSED